MALFLEFIPNLTEGNNIAFIGVTNTGKSTMINSLIGKEVAEIGCGETTKKITAYSGADCVLWDLPGRILEELYTSMKYISSFKRLTRRLILITSTVRECSRIMGLFEENGLDYDIIVNKMDQIEEKKRSEFYDYIKKEISEIGPKRLNHIFFVSAKYPRLFPDWIKMVNSLIIRS